MAGKLRSVTVVFQAFTEKFEKAIDKAGNKMTGFGKKAAIAYAVIKAAQAVFNKFAGELERLNKLGKISDSLQVSPDFIRGVELAANRAGESFEKAQDAIKEFNIRMGEAALGTGPAVEALELLGFTIDDFKNKSPEEAFKQVSKALSEMEDPQLQIFAAGELFGGAGEDILSTFGQIEKSMEEMKDISGPLNDEDIYQANQLNESLTELSARWDAIIQKVGAELAPLFTLLVDILNFLLEISQEILKVWDAIQGAVEDAISYVFFAGEGMDIEVGVRTTPRQIQAVNRLKKDESEKFKQANLKSFTEAISFQSTQAFDALNPDRNQTIEKQQLSKLDQINEGIKKISDGDGVKLIKKDMK